MTYQRKGELAGALWVLMSVVTAVLLLVAPMASAQTVAAETGAALSLIVVRDDAGWKGDVSHIDCGCDDSGLNALVVWAPIGAAAGGVVGWFVASR